VRIGSLTLSTNLCLAPLAGYTNLPFRLVVRSLGGLGLATTELVNARSLLERRPKALQLLQTHPADTPLAAQLFGSVPEEMRDAAQVLEARGVAAIDLNMGCPAPKVCRSGSGSALLANPDRAVAVARAVVAAVRVPVTAKMRLGWDAAHVTAPELARALEDAGVAAVFVHGRTRDQGFSGPVSLAGIRAVVAAVRRIPVVGNGDVTTPEAARVMLEQTGCAGVSIGRGAFYDPWIFSRTWHYLQTGQPLPEPTFEQRVALMSRHLDLMIELFGEAQGCRMFRKIAPWYARRFGPCRPFNQRVVHLSTREQFYQILAEYRRFRERFLDAHGQLQTRYAPVPLEAHASFLAGPDAAGAAGIPVPKGPVDAW